MATARAGHVDSQQQARLNWFSGTAYPTAPVTLYIGFFTKPPLSDGTGGTEVSPATRPAITFGTLTTDANGRHYLPNVAISNVTLTNTSQAEVIAFGLFSANSGGSLYYYDRLPSPLSAAAGATISLAAGALRVFAEPPTI